METEKGLEIIASLARVVSDDPEPDLLASHLALRVLGHLDCRAVAIGAIQKEGFLDLIGNYGLSKKTTTPYLSMPLWSALPMTEAARTGEFIFLHDDKETVKRFPNMKNAIEHKNLITVASPIFHRNTIIGSIAFSSKISPQTGLKTNPMTETALALVGIYVRHFMEKRSKSSLDNALDANSLSARQLEIIKLFRIDLTTDQMADRLKFSHSTIKQDIIKIYELFGINNRSQIVELAEKAGLVEPDNQAS